MMTKKGIMLGVLGLAATGAAVYSFGASAYQGDPNKKGPNYSPERHEQMEKAFENKDYNAWKKLMQDRGKNRITEIINEKNFPRFAEMHELREAGKFVEADKIRQELGLGQGPGKHNENCDGAGQGKGQRGQNRGGNFGGAN